MNHYKARQRRDSGRWEYSVKNSTGAYPLGYCEGYHVYTPEQLSFFGAEHAEVEAARLNAKYESHKHKFHSDGHATPEEAVQCYREYLLDHELKFSDKPDEESQHRCAVCGEWTQLHARITGDHFHHWSLCEQHLNRESVARILKEVGESWGS